jgi:hypothetical protein
MQGTKQQYHPYCHTHNIPNNCRDAHQFVNFIKQHYRVVDTNCLQALDDTARHRANVCSAMAPDV